MLDKMIDKTTPVAQPLADDIEDMQIQYGVNMNGDSAIDSTE